MRGWLKEKRTEKNLTMSQMAGRMNITESYYSMIESGERQKKMDLSIASQLSMILDLPLMWIIEKEEEQ